MVDFSREQVVRATRRPHFCVACASTINVGTQAVRWSGSVDGDFVSVTFHPECREAEIALNALHDTIGDEWIRLADLEREDDAWLVAEHPIVAARLGIPRA